MSVIEWLTGDRIAYSDRTNNIEIKADWSNGNVGTTGRSYAGNTQFGLATTGVKGLKTIVPVAGIASYYDYCCGQGKQTRGVYCPSIAWMVNSRIASPEWSPVADRYYGYSQLMRREESALNGDYGPHWAKRDYTIDNWYKNWGPSAIKCPILIVFGANDDNVRPKQGIMMNEAAKKAGVDVKWIWHQGEHMTPTFPSDNPNTSTSPRPFTMYCGDYVYDEWLNLWFSHHLYGIDNGVMRTMPGVLAQDNASGEWIAYDTFGLDSRKTIVLNDANRVGSPGSSMSAMSIRVYEEPEENSSESDVPDHAQDDAAENNKESDKGTIVLTPAEAAADSLTVINSANGSSSWQNFLDAPTAGSTVYHLDLDKNVTVKGVIKVNMRAAISSVGSNVTDVVPVHAKLVEIAAPGTTLKYYGNNSMGGTPTRTILKQGGYWQGGGIEDAISVRHSLVEFGQRTDGTYREIAKGWIDMSNPKAVFEGYTAARTDRISLSDDIGVFHNYSIFFQPAIHTALKGNKLALIITTGGTSNASTAAHTGNNAFTFTIDNEATNVEIPIAVPVISLYTDDDQPVIITVTEGEIDGKLTVDSSATMGAALKYQWYSNTTNSNVGGNVIAGETDSSFTIPKKLKEGTYYYFCEISATDAEPVRSDVFTVVVEEECLGCNVGYGIFTILAALCAYFLHRARRK